jgi:hypothetical protein
MYSFNFSMTSNLQYQIKALFKELVTIFVVHKLSMKRINSIKMRKQRTKLYKRNLKQ